MACYNFTITARQLADLGRIPSQYASRERVERFSSSSQLIFDLEPE
jgi:hypothetical protein